VRSYHLDALLGQRLIQRVAVISFIPNQPLGLIRGKGPRVSWTRVTSCGEADAAWTETARPEPSATAMSFVPLPRLVFPTPSPLYCYHKCSINLPDPTPPSFEGLQLKPRAHGARFHHAPTSGNDDDRSGREETSREGPSTLPHFGGSRESHRRPLGYLSSASPCHPVCGAVAGSKVR
jgi:hypothetical protein